MDPAPIPEAELEARARAYGWPWPPESGYQRWLLECDVRAGRHLVELMGCG